MTLARGTMVVVAASALVMACGSSQKQDADPAKPVGNSPPATMDAPDIGDGLAWADKSHRQKAAFMKVKVMPAMRIVWKEGPEPEKEMDCGTCHGEAFMEGNFEMPTPSLPALDPSGSFSSHDRNWLVFMSKKFSPMMAQTLGVEPYNPETGTGFGCFSCHTMKKSDNPAAKQ